MPKYIVPNIARHTINGFDAIRVTMDCGTPVADVYCGHNSGGITGPLYGAERITAALNAIEGIPTFALQSPDPNTAGPYSVAVLRETLRDLVQQFYNNDTEGLAHSIALVEMNVSMLSGEG